MIMAAAIAGVTNTASTTATSAAAAATTAAQNTQDRFLKLLVAQMQNQDPLNPMDNAAVTTQMAQIQTVQGIEKLNATLQTNTQAQAYQSVGMIGRNVLAPGSFIDLAAANGGGGAGFDLATAADSVKVTVIDAQNNVVRHLDLGKQSAGASVFSWNGMNDAGAAAPDGTYTFQVDAKLAGSKVAATSLSVGAVNSVLMNSSGPSLNVNGMGLVDMAQIRQVM